MNEYSWVGSAGSCAAALLVMYFCLKYIRDRDTDLKVIITGFQTTVEKIGDKLESSVTKFETTIRVVQMENQQTVQNLFVLQREVIDMLGEFKTELVTMRTDLSRFTEAQPRRQKPTEHRP